MTYNGNVSESRRWQDLTGLSDRGEVAGFVYASEEQAHDIAKLDIHALMASGCAARSVILLIQRRAPPRFAYREDPPIVSFFCTGDILHEYISTGRSVGEIATYGILSVAIESPSRPTRIETVQFPGHFGRPFSVITSRQHVWVIPHFGATKHLDICLAAVQRASGGRGCSNVVLAVDGPADPMLKRVVVKYGIHRAYEMSIGRNGPYVLRNALVDKADTELLLFQDSDDVPCANRAAVLSVAFAQDPSLGMVGSHEVRLDEIRKVVVAVRYPLDVTAALQIGPSHALLHPTAAIQKARFLAAGGFSTFARHSMDTQFLLRSHFHFETRNVDEFLYIRRWHPGSLCTDEESGLGSLSRAELLVSWGRAFMQALKTKSVSGTALEVRHRKGVALDLKPMAISS